MAHPLPAKNADFKHIADRAHVLLTAVKLSGTDPHAAREVEEAKSEANARTLEIVYQEWLQNPAREKTLRPPSLAAYNWQFKHLRPRLGSTPVTAITKELVVRAIEEIRKATTDPERGRRGYISSKCLRLMQSVCRYALRKGYIDRDPTLGIDLPAPLKNPGGKATRPPTDEELRAIWNGGDAQMAASHLRALKLAFLLGKRVSEIVQYE